MTTAEQVFATDFVCLPRIFPAEIWKLISNKLLMTNPSDLENFAMSSPFFQNLLADQRSNYLLGKVFPLVASSVWKMEGCEGLLVSDVLKCRGVCANWNAVIDKWIPEKYQALRDGPHGNQTLSKVQDTLQSLVGNFEFKNLVDFVGSNKSVSQFLQHFKYSHSGDQPDGRNPLIWRDFSVIIFDHGEDEEEAYQLFLDDISADLSKYGSHLHKFSVDHSNFEFFGNVSKLREWVSCMPNLKVLKYTCYEKWHATNGSCTVWSPFPKLKHLDTMEIESLPGPVLNHLISQNPQISTLRLSFWHPDNNIFRFPLPNLKNLELCIDTARMIEIIGSEQIQWPMQSLKLLYISDSPDLVGLATLFQMVQDKFSHVLVSFELELCLDFDKNGEIYRQVCEDCKTCRLDLPNLKKIELDMSKILISLDFMLPMKRNLEEISVCVEYGCPIFPKTTQVSGSIVQFVGFEGKMLDSNIWAIFKKLKQIQVTAQWEGKQEDTRRYSREEWMLSNEYA